MTVELALIISIVSVAFSVYFGLKNSRHTDTKDIEERVKDRAELNIKLDFISRSTNEIKEQISSLMKEVQAHGDRLIKVEESCKQAHHRLDSLERKVSSEEVRDNE